jgi:hypothetical protein
MVRLAIAAAVLALAAAGCGDDSSGPESAGAPLQPAPSTSTAEETDPDAATKPCSVVPAPPLATVFPSGVPKGDAKPLGEGFASCTWENGDASVLVSIVPAPNLQKDYKSQLNTLGPITSSLVVDGVAFPGTVGIGKANSKGRTVGFTTRGNGYLVAVRTGSVGHPDADLAHATALAEAIVRGS